MAKHKNISALFLDIGGVLLTNGWDYNMRRKAAEQFNLEYDELDDRHHMTFDTYEEGKLSMDEYLNLVVFHKKRAFSFEDFKKFIFAQTKPLPDMINMFKSIAKSNSLKVGAISNEGRELTVYRVSHFGLKDLIQFFICSSFVHFRKPDKDIYRLALDVGQVVPEQSIYVDDRELHTEVARSLGMNAIYHTDIETTRHKLSEYGLTE
jgi:putative hydrolase of the HAD superfamily